MTTLHAKLDGSLLAYDHVRVVHGERGSYIEIERELIYWQNFVVPSAVQWRIDDPVWKNRVYYIEYRSRGIANVMLYHQMKTVDYADYKIGMFYIALEDVMEKVT